MKKLYEKVVCSTDDVQEGDDIIENNFINVHYNIEGNF